ncbi:MAG TPA: Glu/Leu/Phe/Val dehydrogenase dimerization domain-containing protein [Vicinamibacterales bacterium]|nr:Glu/Leu/Phe/Val dehydrogenase dimerization domain-containing protein [Vicinamibacterales bacterium]
MTVFDHPSLSGHERVVFINDPASGLRAIIAIHDTSRGPALGGCRVWSYESEAAALEDVLRLSRAMTYKAAAADLPLGGGKAVVIQRPAGKTAQQFQVLGQAIEGLGGRYIVAEDVGTVAADMLAVRSQTRYVTGTAPENGGRGEPSPATAYGCYVGLLATARRALRRDDLNGVRVLVQGLGNVGYGLCQYLHEAGARLIVTDIDPRRMARAEEAFGARAVGVDDIFDVDAEILSPNALGGVLDDSTIARLRVAAIAGGANNQLADATWHGETLRRRGILYAPDYVINSGGLTHACGEYFGWDEAVVKHRVAGIGRRLGEIYDIAAAEGETTHVIADRLAEQRLEQEQPKLAA